MPPARPWRIASAARMMLGAGVMVLGLGSGSATAQPSNDDCAAAVPVLAGDAVIGSVFGATSDGDSVCNFELVGDVYHSFVPPVAGTYTFSLCGTAWDTVLSLHVGCPANLTTAVACDDEGCRPAGSTSFGYASSLTVMLPAGVSYIVRISAYDSFTAGDVYTLRVVGPTTPTGACCFAGQCSLQTQLVCSTAGGVYRGDYTACASPAGNPTIYTAAASNVPIPDNAPAGITSVINVPDSYAVGDVRAELTLNHTFLGDLTATLSHGSTTITLFERIGGGSNGDDSNFNGTYALTDAAGQTIWTAAIGAPDSVSLVTGGAYRATDEFANTVSLRAAFAGGPADGVWTLGISDGAAFDTGTLVGWRLVLDRSGGDPCDPASGACCIGSTCQITTAMGCSGPMTRFAGGGVACNAPGNGTNPCCKSDFNQSGSISVQDLFDFLAAYFGGLPTADYNGVGGNSVQDIFDFLGGFFGGCG